MTFPALRAFAGLVLFGLCLVLLSLALVAAFGSYTITIPDLGPTKGAIVVTLLATIGVCGLLVAIVDLLNLVHIRIGL